MAQPARNKSDKIVGKRNPGKGIAERRPKEKAAGRLASMIEQHMSDLGLSEEEKNLRVAGFSKRVDTAIESRAKS